MLTDKEVITRFASTLNWDIVGDVYDGPYVTFKTRDSGEVVTLPIHTVRDTYMEYYYMEILND